MVDYHDWCGCYQQSSEDSSRYIDERLEILSGIKGTRKEQFLAITKKMEEAGVTIADIMRGFPVPGKKRRKVKV
jgi:hypothetical protein